MITGIRSVLCCPTVYFCILFFKVKFYCLIVFIVAKDEVGNDAAGQEGVKKKRNRKRNKAKGWFILMDIIGLSKL